MRSGQGERALQRDQTSALGKGAKQVMWTGPGRQGQLAWQTEKTDLPTGFRPGRSPSCPLGALEVLAGDLGVAVP